MSFPESKTSVSSFLSSGTDESSLEHVDVFIQNELQKIDKTDEEQRFIAFRTAFDKVIEQTGAYKPFLVSVKVEYENVITTLQSRQREAAYLSGKLKTIASRPSTVQNYRKRAHDLEANMALIQEDNERLRNKLEALKAVKELRNEPQEAQNIASTLDDERKVRSLPGLTLQESTDPVFLQQKLEKINVQFEELIQARKTKYLPKEDKQKLKGHLASKVVTRDQLTDKTDLLKYKAQKLKLAVEAAQAYMELQPPHQTVGDAVVNALHRANTQGALNKDEVFKSMAFEDDDPAKEKEAEIMLEYIEKFTELMEDEKYEEAAVHAANSPKGILRTVETMQKFMDVPAKTTKGRSALLAFCEALLATVPAYDAKPNELISFEAVLSALNENRHDLVGHWITQNRLTCSEAMGNLLHKCAMQKPQTSAQCMAWAQYVYCTTGHHRSAIECMLLQGKVQQTVQYAQINAKFSATDFAGLLRSHPTDELSEAVAAYVLSGRAIMPIGLLAVVLQEIRKEGLALQMISTVCCPQDSSREKGHRKIRQLVNDDPWTSTSQWCKLAALLQKRDHRECGLELLAASAVKKAITQAKNTVFQTEAKSFAKKRSRVRFLSESDEGSSDQ